MLEHFTGHTKKILKQSKLGEASLMLCTYKPPPSPPHSSLYFSILQRLILALECSLTLLIASGLLLPRTMAPTSPAILVHTGTVVKNKTCKSVFKEAFPTCINCVTIVNGVKFLCSSHIDNNSFQRIIEAGTLYTRSCIV